MEISQNLKDKGFLFSEINESDISDYLAIKKVCYRKYVDEYFGGWVDDVQVEMNTNAFNKLSGKSNFLKILLHGEVVGFFSFDVLENKISGITIQMIDRAQNMGVGSFYIEHITAISKKNKIPIFLKVFKSNPVKNLYKRYGFKIYKETFSHYLMRFDPNERRKYLGRYDKDLIKSIISKIVRTDEIGVAGYVGLVQILEVNRPYMVGEKDLEICIADNGYKELTFLPDNENWQMTAIYDNQNNIIEWYFDITRKNSVDENGNPYCDDLYLDAALMPDGCILIFDEEQLKNAFNNGTVNQKDFDMAYDVLQKLIDDKIINVAYMNEFCSRLLSLF
jgi:predicted RNA-binding protein associated with RNAse of E/G family/ribosomal protein S18 acetylase RimI-like enzyme